MPSMNPFVDRHGNPHRLVGPVLYSASLRLAEVAVQSGCTTVWIDLEHSPTGLHQAEALCMAIEGQGGVPLIRVQGTERAYVLGALECGASIVLVPMVNHADEARTIVHHGKFPPLGNRGSNKNTRGNRYGIHGTAREMMEEANVRTLLFAQIETTEAVANVREILAVDGLAGIFVGPSDLSLSMGIPGELAHPQLIESTLGCIQAAHDAGKRAGTLAPLDSPLFEAARAAGAELLIFGSDVGALATAWQESARRLA
ncbi:MAG: aldolase/citrate lyase family protein [Planctomycetota bacterium]